MKTPNGKLIADVGCEPILHMRHFQVYFLNSLDYSYRAIYVSVLLTGSG